MLLAVLCAMVLFPAAAMAMSPATTGAEPEIIWNFLYERIGNPYGVAGLMGNLQAESALLPVNLQNSGEARLGYTDLSYTEAVDNGSYGKDSFVHDNAGYGLAQWTFYSRKQALYEYAEAADASIGNLQMQLSFLWEEITGDFPGVAAGLMNAASVKEASDLVLTGYEKPADQSDAAKARRAEYAMGWFEKYGPEMPAEEDPENPENPEESAGPLLAFQDVHPGDWFYEDVAYVVERGIMTGMNPAYFGPSVTTSRAMIVTILYRLEGEPSAGTSSFRDVERGSWYDSAVSWAQENGIVSGYNAEKFGPADPITREQLAAILYRYAAWKGIDVSGQASLAGFTDAASVSDWAVPAVAWAKEAGILSGMSATRLNPLGSAERAQAAALFHRFLG